MKAVWIAAGTALGFPLMEAVAWASHRWVMHGPLWVLHRGHHLPSRGGFEANDLFGVFFSAVSIACIAAGVMGRPFVLGLGAGMSLYGLAYLLFHDVLAHARFGKVAMPRSAYLRRLLSAHRIHHARVAKDGGSHFGFLWAPPERRTAPATRT